jgi:hypothetical protein
MGDIGDNSKKFEDIGNSIEGYWKYPKFDDFVFVVPIVFLVHWHILDVFLILQLFFSFFLGDQIHTILSTTMENKGGYDSCREVRHHVVGDYNFLT